MAAALAGYRKGLVSAGWPDFLPYCTSERRKWSFHLVGTPFLAFKGSFQSGGAFSGRRALTIERSVMSGVVRVMNLRRTSEEAVALVSWADSWGKWKYR